ncbi:MAG TPA: HAMP domain-containing sensor histidine kinase [Candidatus Hydrogenedentes bacterium]|nr:HAMP domain-containing sensor histidine kinase [Candidatus Hydrogenedentota bacterium]
MRQETASQEFSGRTPWRKSLLMRGGLLCAVMLGCLFLAAGGITRHFFRESARQMEAQTEEIIRNIEVRLDQGFYGDLGKLERDLRDLHRGFDIHLQEQADTGEQALTKPSFSYERLADGRFLRTVRVPVRSGVTPMLLTVSMEIEPQREVLLALTNRFMLVVVGTFITSLALMFWVLAQTLRPLRRLAEKCAAVSRGALETVATRGARGEVLELENTFNRMVESLREKEEIEAKLLQAQRLSALGTLAAGVAHDVRNPLNAIKLLSSHALDRADTRQSPSAVRALETIRGEVERLESIISRFLALARETELRPAPIDADRFVLDALELVRRDAENRGVTLQVEAGTGGLIVLVDANQLSRALLNVVMNALEACPKGRRVRVFSRVTAEHWEMEVRDNGPGMSAEVQRHVFDPYFSTKPGGTGLGLSIARNIVEEHGGEMELSSSEGQGCQVVMRLPLARVRGAGYSGNPVVAS